MNQEGFGKFYLASVEFEPSVLYADKITVLWMESGGFGESDNVAVCG